MPHPWQDRATAALRAAFAEGRAGQPRKWFHENEVRDILAAIRDNKPLPDIKRVRWDRLGIHVE